MKNWPENGLAVVRIMSVEVTVITEDCQGLVVVLQLLGNAGFDMTVKCVCRHAKCTNPCLLLEQTSVTGSLNRVAEATITHLGLIDGET